MSRNHWDIAQIRSEFPTLTRQVRGKPLVYLDNAASTLKPRPVIDRMTRYYENEVSNVHRGAHYLAEQGTIAYEAAREQIARFVNAASPAEIVFTRGTTESVNVVAQTYGRVNFKAGDEIILSELEHHSNIVPWQMIAEEKGCRIRVIPITDTGEMDFNAYLQLLGPKTKMVAISWCSNALGTVTDISRYIRAAHDVGAKVFIDAAQAVQHLKTDVQALDCDFLAFSGHKIYGPYGIGVLYGKADLLEAMPPYQGGGSMIADVTFDKTTYALAPQKFEAGTPAISGAIGLGSAIEYVGSLGLENIERHEQMLLAKATEALRAIPGLRILGEAPKKAAILSFVFDGVHPSDIGSLIDHEGIAIRTGHHCTQPLMRRLGVPATARASFAVYNSVEDVEALQSALVKVKEFF
ncbi:MAG: cysteine desulfurase [Bdellovibrionaceae bacterium]|nr:cysteine desulfurase [Pseudobdellovibrionaceae bacterium]